MLRLRHLLRSTQSTFRVSPPLSQPVKPLTVRRVKYKKPWVRKFVTSCLIYGTAFHLWSSLVFLQLDDADASEEPRLERTTRENNDNDEEHKQLPERLEDLETTFVPLSLPLIRPGEFYATSDKEWQEFAKFSRDDEKLKKLKSELAAIVLNNASRSNQLSKILGGPLKLSASWLSHHFPYRAPPAYGRLGLEISDFHIALVARHMDGEEGDRLRRVMQPLFVTIAMKDALSVLLRRQLARLRNMSTDDGGKADHPFDPHVLPADLRKLDSLNYAPDRESHPPLSNKSQADISQDRSQGQDSSRLQHPSIIPTLHRLLLPAFGPGSDLHIAFLAFKWRLSDCYARDSPTPRRGSFFVSGPVAIQGRTGSCRVEVKAEYHPATSSWSKVSMQLKDIHLHKQIALGGRSDLP